MISSGIHRTVALGFFVAAASLACAQSEVRFGVLGLFHPGELAVEPQGAGVVAMAGGSSTLILTGEPDHRRALLRADGDRVLVNGGSAREWVASGRGGAPVAFQLSVPGKIRRIYSGRLSITAHRGELLAVVSMEREVAVASIMAAEMPENSAIEALKAQAVVARSFLAAGRRHLEYDFCDTTHCQFLRSPTEAGGRTMAAVNATRGMVLSYHQQPLAAMYSSRCGGQTRSLQEAGFEARGGYPYYSVRCAWCRQHPVRWQSTLGSGANAGSARSEPGRIALARQWGWSAIPGSISGVEQGLHGLVVNGRSIGHAVGLCQFGANGMAVSGADFRSILGHYYPNTQIIQLP